MGKTFENLTWDELCDLMCGGPEDEDNEVEEDEQCGYDRDTKGCSSGI